MSIFEFDEEKEWRMFGEAERKYGYKQGIEKGREEGRREERKELIVSLVKDGILTLQEAAKRFDIPEEELKKYI